MLFNSEQFMIFLPIVILVYYFIPKKVRYIWLLVSSYYFYMSWNAQYALLILTSTVVTYISGILIDKFEKKQIRKWVMIACIVINLGILFWFKYFNFGLNMLSKILLFAHIEINIPTFDIILPVGISFYTFQALSYTIDVYRKETYPEKNFLRYALFVSFFPQLVAGPIERSKNLLKQLAIPQKFEYSNFVNGILLMMWGFFLKIVLADRISIFVDSVYGNTSTYRGWYIVIATMLFAFQIYCDFYGYSVIAMGAARLLGIELMENFNAPYNSKSVEEFWKRWHISLTSWFRDYLYIPLGGNRKGKFRKHLNRMIVFLLSGLWHGASLSFVVWGGLNGLYQIIGDGLKPVRNKVVNLLKLNRDSFGHQLIQRIVTFILIDISWLFFRADGLKGAIESIRNLFAENNPWILFDESLYECGLDRKNFAVMVIAIVILMVADSLKYKKVDIRGFILKQDYWFRWIFIAFTIWIIMVIGIWGPSYDSASFIYFQF